MKQTYEDVDTVSYRYDNNGNILSVTSGGKTTSYTYDSANQAPAIAYSRRVVIEHLHFFFVSTPTIDIEPQIPKRWL